MKKIIISLFGLMLTMNGVTLSANPYMYNENKQQSFTNAHIDSDLCNFKFVLSDDDGFGWGSQGIAITVDGVDYGFVNLPWGTAYAEKIVALPSGEVQLIWHGGFIPSFHFKVYNSSDELIYTSPDDIGGLFFTYQNECSCLPVTDFEGMYI